MEIVRTSGISYKEFKKNHLDPGVPIVFTNATDCWKSEGKLSIEWFRSTFGERKTMFQEKTEYTMNQIFDLTEKSTPENPAPYPFIYNVPGQLPELMEFVHPLDLQYAKPNWLDSPFFKKGHWGSVIELFIGGAGGKFPYVHLDYYHLSAWVTLLHGEKIFTVFPRGQDEFLYPDPGNDWMSNLNVFEPDYEKYPKFRNATPISFTVKAGETLFIPYGIWHTAYSTTPTISILFDQLSAHNAKAFIIDVWKLKKRMGKFKAALTTIYAAMACGICYIGDLAGIKRKLPSEL